MKKLFEVFKEGGTEMCIKLLFHKLLLWVFPLGIMINVWEFLAQWEDTFPVQSKIAAISAAAILFGLGRMLDTITQSLIVQRIGTNDNKER